MKKSASSSGFTLMELIVAISVLGVTLTIATTSLIFISSSDRKLRLAKDVYEDSRFLMERMVKEIRRGTIDYEEYWSKKVLADNNYGQNYSDYAKQFINPGTDPDDAFGIDEYGTECVDKLTGAGGEGADEESPPCKSGWTVHLPSIDKNTGKNPYGGHEDKTNAVCLNNDSCKDEHVQTESYLIYSSGLSKTIIKRTGASSEKIGLLKLVRNDEYTTTWNNHSDFPDKDDNGENNSDGENRNDFVSITPPGIEIVDLKFYLAPLEDPRKAFNESSSDIQHQPHISVLLTAQASEKRMQGLPGQKPKITLQTTVTTRVYRDIPSYRAK